ncbi:hypothetical protein T552_01280 [Pneumocystis carinii B80]|uniref:Uncharacterized protein n=1 Tax=Pneumocystis carinii (strain B80) TaxID=1408658 RepID=A0A0W4ZLS3_PNEC8|nr:hypothetical protein T552_01280 [Pneumocystis carinii B80]KTW29325.1 hypothetical protein T552_01280 [Pneumocystis carinii B80]
MMNPKTQYNSLLAIASSNDKKQEICLVELKKIKALKEADDRIKESQDCNKEREERAKRRYEYEQSRKEGGGKTGGIEGIEGDLLKMKKEIKTNKKETVEKKGRSMSFKELISKTSNMNPEILKMNSISKINTGTEGETSSGSRIDKKEEECCKILGKKEQNFLLKPEMGSKPFQIRKQSTTFTKVPLVKKNELLSKRKGSISLTSKFSTNKGKKNNFLAPLRSKNLTKSKIITEFHPNDLILLHTGPKRDCRTIEEIQNSIWRRKKKNFPFLYKNEQETNSSSGIPSKNGESGNILSQNSSSAKQDINYKKAKPDSSQSNKKLDYNISSEIWKIFGKRKEDYMSNNYDSDSDMETSATQLQKEEEFSSKIGKIEDNEEKRKEIERKIKKKRKLNMS